jgi:hypothetical protein
MAIVCGLIAPTIRLEVLLEPV